MLARFAHNFAFHYRKKREADCPKNAKPSTLLAGVHSILIWPGLVTRHSSAKTTSKWCFYPQVTTLIFVVTLLHHLTIFPLSQRPGQLK